MFEGTFIKCASIGYVISKWPKELVNGCKILRSFHQLRPEVFSRMMVAPRVITYLQKFIPYDMMVQCCMHSAVCVRFFFFTPIGIYLMGSNLAYLRSHDFNTRGKVGWCSPGSYIYTALFHVQQQICGHAKFAFGHDRQSHVQDVSIATWLMVSQRLLAPV